MAVLGLEEEDSKDRLLCAAEQSYCQLVLVMCTHNGCKYTHIGGICQEGYVLYPAEYQ